MIKYRTSPQIFTYLSELSSAQSDEFIKKYTPAVIKATRGTGLFPSIAMAQMLIESSGKDANGNWGAGNGITARKANNFFGIKADKNYKGKKMSFATPKDNAPVNYFRVYPNATDSIKDHTNFLKVNSRYAKAGAFKASTPYQQADALAKAGYSENPYPRYRDGLMQIIKAYHLQDLDKQAGIKTRSKTIYWLIGGTIAIGAGVYAYETYAVPKWKLKSLRSLSLVRT